MSLRDEMLESGRYLFRWRSYFPLLVLAFVLLMLVDFEHFGGSEELNLLWEGICGAVAAAGLLLRAFAVGSVPAQTSGRNTAQQVAASLNVKGVYSAVRHPLYLGNYLIWLGIALFAHTWWVLVIVTLTFWLYYERIMLAEEEFLRQRFGSEFEDWAARTPAFIPNIGHWVPSSLPFSWKTVLARENSTLLATVVIFFLLEVTGNFFAGKLPHLDLGWTLLLAAAAVTYVVLRLMKKYGHLAVDGR